MEKITSIKNSKIKDWVKLRTTHGRKKFGQYLLEGRHPVQEALQASIDYDYIVINEEYAEEDWLTDIDSDKLIVIDDAVTNHLSDTVHSQGIFLIGLIDQNQNTIPKDLDGKWLGLDNVQDPGNIGTMIRTADAAGYAGVVLGAGTADIYNPKILRSMQGSQFHIQIVRTNLLDWIQESKVQHHETYGSLLDQDAIDYQDAIASDDFTVIVGNEGNGMTPEIAQATTKNLYIPIKGQAESLNVAIAAGVLMFTL
ncbi:TrmH family RNA methyltransferase [Pediococcus argentinicus]|uniref:rRNA methylase n=1 Tax=Pediococcus argentinicus TaxID=480391 RepID=A0A0R2NHT7_9LACO|nr:RNA methyltransferase [Pediococcus argentinicus]KRO25375.1 rRNA methylase [Pediococcus argentinicus]NKZ22293.1 RNA methyltransferase [Pediococcus argentinicus]GEP19342.1 23S rRNA methyltransferase [Pediococcus argentinicus]